MVNSNRELVLVRNLRWLNKEYSFSVHFIPFFPFTLFLFSKTRIHSASGGQEMLIRREAFNQGDIYENEGTWGTRLFQWYFGLRGWQLIRDIPYFGGRFKETCNCHWPFFSILRTDYPSERTLISLSVHMVRRNSTPGGFAYIWQSKWVGIIAI